MIRFIPITNIDGETEYVNIDRIVRISPEIRDGFAGCKIHLADSGVVRCGEPLKSIVDRAMAADRIASFPMDMESEIDPDSRLGKHASTVGESVREAREHAGLTQSDLAVRTGLPQSHLSRIENGRLSPSRLTLEKIAGGLNRPLGDFDPSADDRPGPSAVRPLAMTLRCLPEQKRFLMDILFGWIEGRDHLPESPRIDSDPPLFASGVTSGPPLPDGLVEIRVRFSPAGNRPEA